ncbi:MAG TPA: hypothetical protein PKW55_02240 [Spirochaetota bacterium]|nr:hypothetical protein [Spirochaetota bacterium]HOM38332.1 hypothetical protein [Spirochaetota bacterium]
MIDNIRYHYDRQLIKENYQYIHIISPVETFTNLKVLEKKIRLILKSSKKIKVITSIVSYTVQESPMIFLNIENYEKIKDLYDSIVYNFPEFNSFFYPHIIVVKNHKLEETQIIYEELKDIDISQTFFSDSVSIYVKNRVWDRIVSIEL